MDNRVSVQPGRTGASLRASVQKGSSSSYQVCTGAISCLQAGLSETVLCHEYAPLNSSGSCKRGVSKPSYKDSKGGNTTVVSGVEIHGNACRSACSLEATE